VLDVSAWSADVDRRRYPQGWNDELWEGNVRAGVWVNPYLRPMPLAYPGDRGARDADLQYLLGPKLLVAPLLAPGGVRQLWIPPGTWQPLHGTRALSGQGGPPCCTRSTSFRCGRRRRRRGEGRGGDTVRGHVGNFYTERDRRRMRAVLARM
jgi:hypothetical protein